MTIDIKAIRDVALVTSDSKSPCNYPKTDLEEMNATPDQIKHGIAQTLDGGIEIESCGKVYFAGFNVVVQVID